MKRALVTFFAASPQPEAAEYLLVVLETASEKLARNVVDTLATSRYAALYDERAAAIMAERQARKP